MASRSLALVITPVWDSTIANDPNASTIESTINTAIQFYETRFADPINVSIEFAETNAGLGQSDWRYNSVLYSEFRTALQQDATTANDTNALAHLPNSPANPINGDGLINVKTANLKAIGLTGYNSGLPGGVDGIVTLNTSIMNLTRTDIDPSKYDLLSVAEHEMDEVLGLGSYLGSGVSADDPFPQDLFRYTSAGGRSFTTSGDDAYFSLDGKNFLVQFNQAANGDYGDWWSSGSHIPRVQDAFATAGVTPNPNVELVALDVQGYDLLPPPQPGIASIGLCASNLTVNATNGLAASDYVLLESDNLALPPNQWTAVATNFLTTNGNFTFTATNAIDPTVDSQFYMLQLQ
ncbi:MAG TPA: NF038122 family metalloprotease [Verrucomicrobiae bacterium]|nr:NF038122 family metalloprotease [Verrucomicrobiae bacterium]